MGLGSFVFIGILVFVAGSEQAGNNDPSLNSVFPEEEAKICTVDDVQTISQAFHNCFIDKKYKDGGKDLENLISRILDHSKLCIENSTLKCRPNLKGFAAIIDQVILEVKDYCHIYLEHITKEKEKIKDLQCIERDLSISTYQSCFKGAFENVAGSSKKKFQQHAEDAISCTNKSSKLCSRSAKMVVNRMVREILRVEQPEKEEHIEDEAKPEPPKMWYHSIIQPFVSMWRAIRSFFGF